MSDIQDKIAQAKAAGYSDSEIASHLAASPDYGGKIKAATAAGYKPEEIVGHLAGPTTDADRVAAMAATGDSIVDGIKGAAMGAGAGFGKVLVGAQRLAGKWLAAADDLMPGKPAPKLSDLVTGHKPTTILERATKRMVDDADAGKAMLDAQNAPYKAASPIANAVGEMGGSMIATAPIGGLVPNALKTAAGANTVLGVAARGARAAGVGAIYGGVTGAVDSGADTVRGVVADGVKSAAAGAALGGTLTPAGAVVGAAGRNVIQRMSDSSAAQYAKEKIAEALARDARGALATSGDINPLTQIVARFGKLGDEATVADAAGRNTNQLLDTLATLPGRTKDAAYNLLRQRTAGVGTRLRTAAEEALDTQGQRLPTTVESLITRREQDSAPLYDQLRKTDINPSAKLVDIVKHADELGVTKLGREIATARQMPFTLDAAQPSRWSMGDLDHVKQGIDQVLSSRKAMNQDGTLTPLGNAYKDLKTKLVAALDGATTNRQTGESLYRSAREAFSAPSQLIDAANAGKMAINRDEASIMSTMKGMSDNEVQAFRIGAFEGLRAKLGTQGGQTNIMNMWKEPATQEKLKAVFGDLRSYREFASSVAKEAQLKRLQSVGTGSQTAARLAGMGDLDLAALSEAGGAVGAAKSGNLLAAIGSAKNAWNRVALPQTVRDEMGSVLLTRGAAGKAQLNDLQELVHAINSQNSLQSVRIGRFGGQAGSTLATDLNRRATALPPQQ